MPLGMLSDDESAAEVVEDPNVKARKLFNNKPKDGIKYLIENKIIDESPVSIAKWLYAVRGDLEIGSGSCPYIVSRAASLSTVTRSQQDQIGRVFGRRR